MGSIADKVLNNDIGGVGLEGDAVVAVVDVRVLNHNVAAAVCVPAVGVLRRVRARAATKDIDVGVYDVGRVGDQVIPLRAVAELQILN